MPSLQSFFFWPLVLCSGVSLQDILIFKISFDVHLTESLCGKGILKGGSWGNKSPLPKTTFILL